MSVPRLSELAGIIHNPSQPFLIPPLPPGFVPSADKQPVACGGWNAASLGSQAPTIEVHGSDQDQARSASHFQITGIGFSGIQVTPDEPLFDRRCLKPCFFGCSWGFCRGCASNSALGQRRGTAVRCRLRGVIVTAHGLSSLMEFYDIRVRNSVEDVGRGP